MISVYFILLTMILCIQRTDDGAFLGTTTGAVTWVNVDDGGLPVELFRVQTSPISRLEHSKDGRRLLVCADWGEPALVVVRLSPNENASNGTPWLANSENMLCVFRIGFHKKILLEH